MDQDHSPLSSDSSDEEGVQHVRYEVTVIPDCEGVPRRLWMSKMVQLHNGDGLLVGEGICYSVDSTFVAGCNGALGDSFVAVQICKAFYPVDIPEDWRYSLRAWPIAHAFLNGSSLHDHNVRYEYNFKQASMGQPSSSTKRPYRSTRNPPRQSSGKAAELLTQESINAVSSKVCCSSNCVQPFPRDKIRAFRERMYRETSHEFKQHMKLDVHRQVHRNSQGKRVVTVEGIDVCLPAWRHIAGVSETSFYRFQGYVASGVQARPHGNAGLHKSRKQTLQATAILKSLFEKSADHMPHRSHTMPSGEKVVAMVMPASFTWKQTIPEINRTNACFGLKEVSPSNVSNIKKSNFPQYSAKKPGDNFARCSTCDRLNTLKRTAVAGLKRKYTRKLEKHLAKAKAHRDQYYANRYKSTAYPTECLTIMHDKMDHAKTASPVFSHKSKQLDGLMKLPVSVTGMIAHGHGDVKYAHYGLDLFAHDANYTVGSFAKLLRDLELPPKYSSRELFNGSGSAPLFCAVLQGADICKTLLRAMPADPIEATPLPPVLNVQMDNATGDNKNRYVFAFWSLLVAKKIFREVYVSFMLVGHTHDDIDALFGRWSMQLKKENFPTIPSLMKSFMDVDGVSDKPTIPHLIEEVPDFKTFIENALLDGDDRLVGHTKAQHFKFYMNAAGVPIMKYKIYCTDNDWLPEDGIKLWKEDSKGQSLWPRGHPVPVEYLEMRSVEDISKGITGFIKYWEALCNEDGTGEYRRRFEHYVFYWRAVLACLKEPIQASVALKDGFWPSTRVEATEEDELDDDGEAREEFGEDDLFVGNLRNRPLPSFRVARDLFDGYFVAIRPADEDPKPIWIARALSDPFADANHPNCMLIQYFKPASRVQNVQEFYHGWDSQKGLRWKVDEFQPPIWENTNSIVTAWKSKVKKDTVECVLKIPRATVDVINSSLSSYNSD